MDTFFKSLNCNDISFGAEPSKEQREMAQEAGKEVVMTPIGNEEFVYFVNPDNKIDSLAVSHIKDKDNKKRTIRPFLDWMQGPQGQEIVEDVGYIKAVER